MLITRGIRRGDIIEFDYDDPKTGPPHRVGTIGRMYRAKKNNLLLYVILDQSIGGQYRQFYYKGMRNIKVRKGV